MNLLEETYAFLYRRGKKANIKRTNRRLNVPHTSRIGDVNFNEYRNVEIGEHSYINSGYISGAVKIGAYCAIGYNVSLIALTHDTDHATGELPLPQNRAKIVIEDGVWIGNNAVILPGVRIGRKAVVGANAVVTRSVPPHSVVGGVPAKLLRVIES